jgi:hypothetical protein
LLTCGIKRTVFGRYIMLFIRNAADIYRTASLVILKVKEN